MLEGRLQQVHLNDNYRDWDHDLVPGAVNVWDHVEFFYWLRKLGFQGWCAIDMFPCRNEGVEVVRRAVQVVDKCCQIADRLMEMNVDQIIREGRTMEVMRILWDMVG
jgi:xylose isomerase